MGAGDPRGQDADGGLLPPWDYRKTKSGKIPPSIRRTASAGYDVPAAGPAASSVPASASFAPSMPNPAAPSGRLPPSTLTTESVLITGAAGFIASHMVLLLLEETKYRITAVDDMSRSHPDTVTRLHNLAQAAGAVADDRYRFVQQDFSDEATMVPLMRARGVHAVIHFAGNAYVGESMGFPDKYYQNITVGTLRLLRAMDGAGVRQLIFSSSCATFGDATELPIVETTPQRPTNPYGLSKLHAEQAILMKAAVRRRDPGGPQLAAASLRYFNVIGADPKGRMGPVLAHPEQKKYPRVVDAALEAVLGLRKQLVVSGSDFQTRDGTCVRDYIHVTDLVRAHLDALRHLDPGRSLVYNIGTGRGSTVLEVIRAVEAATGKAVPHVIGPRRPGDPAELWASPSKAMRELGWRPEFTNLTDSVRTSWTWRKTFYPVDISIDA